jgi:acetolactate synthase-1/2/3 large subunit
VNGAHALIQTLVTSGVEVCFANPGTSEMHFVAAVDDVPDLRIVLALFEGVATGAADGYARMTDQPAATLLHLGPGLANGLANLHNARRARVPVVNIVGDHATYHKHFDAPLNSDIEPAAGTVSGWVTRPTRPADIGRAAASAVAAALGAPPMVSTLILPADVSWGDGAIPAPAQRPTAPATVPDNVIDSVAKVLASGQRCLLLAGGRAARAEPLRALSRIATATGARTLLETSTARLERGGGIPVPQRLAYRADAAVAQLSGIEHLILVDAKAPSAYFAYPDKASDLVPPGCAVHVLTSPGDDTNTALDHLADLVAAGVRPDVGPVGRAERPTGALTPTAIGAALSALIPDGAVVTDEGVSSGRFVYASSAGAPRHDWLGTTGGAIGMGLPLALGAAVAVGGRKVIGVQADGSAMYTIQALWTMARENLDVAVIILNNRRYNILRGELNQVGAAEGPKALDMLDLSRPDLDFVALSTGLGVAAERATTAEGFTAALERALTETGPRLVQADI